MLGFMLKEMTLPGYRLPQYGTSDYFVPLKMEMLKIDILSVLNYTTLTEKCENDRNFSPTI